MFAEESSLDIHLTLDEKLSMLHGACNAPLNLGQAGYNPGIPHLGIPELRLADGPAGVRVSASCTVMSAPVSLAATFDPDLAFQYGMVIGREGQALGQDVLLSPMINLVRVPYAGRNFETMGEDPFLTSAIMHQEVSGI